MLIISIMIKTINDKRIKILRYSLNLENIASHSLAFIIGVEHNKVADTKSLGNFASSLSFNQKINLLLDNQSISKEEKFKLEAFMSIRNQFMHNISIKSYQDVYNHINGLENKIKKIYPQEFCIEKDIESSLEICTERLYSQGMSIFMSSKGEKEKKLNLMTERTVYKNLYENNEKAIDRAIMELITSIEKDELNYLDKDELFENIKLLKMQIMVYQQFDSSEE